MKSDKSTIAKALTGDCRREEHLFVLKQEFELYKIYQGKIAECGRNIEGHYKTFEIKSSKNKQYSEMRSKSKNKPNFAAHAELYRITGIDFTKIPGLDVSTIQTILSEVGLNDKKWSSEKQFTSWLGLCPSNRITGEKVFRTGTRTVASRTANVFRIAAQCVLRSKSAIGAYGRRLKKRLGAPKAITATARKLACIFYQMLKYGQEYIEKGMDYYETRYKDRELSKT